MAAASALAYYGTETIIVIKSFIAQALEDLVFSSDKYISVNLNQMQAMML